MISETSIFRRCYFTMLEILLVIVIIGMIAGVIGINVTRAVREQRFRSEVDLVVDQLRLAQDLMVIFHANVSVIFTINDTKNTYTLELVPEVALPTPWLKEITRNTKLTNIHTINYEELKKEETVLKLNFRSGGSEMPYGTMRLSTAEREGPGVTTRYIHFPGYPAPISATSSNIFPYKDDEEMNKELTQKTVEVIRAIMPISTKK